MVSAASPYPPHRGEGNSPLSSGKITLKFDGDLTDEDVKEIYARYKCKASIVRLNRRNPQKVLQVTCKADASSNLTDAVKMAEEKIKKNAEAKVTLSTAGRPQRRASAEQLPVPLGRPQPQHTMMSKQMMPHQQQKMPRQQHLPLRRQ